MKKTLKSKPKHLKKKHTSTNTCKCDTSQLPTYPYKVIVKNTIEETNIACAQAIIDIVHQNKQACLGLATGGSVIPVYQYLIKDHVENKTDYSKIKTFNLDEYIGLDPLYIHESYRAFMNFRLFININIQLKNTHFPNPKNPSAYETLIKNNGGLDMQIVSFGHNGHIAYNEPGSCLQSETRVIKLTQSTINANSRFFENNKKLVPKTAVTMGIKSIMGAKKIIVLVTGIGKAEAFKHLLMNKYDPKWPCTSLIFHNNVEVFVDKQTAIAAGYRF